MSATGQTATSPDRQSVTASILEGDMWRALKGGLTSEIGLQKGIVTRMGRDPVSVRESASAAHRARFATTDAPYLQYENRI